MCEAAVEREQAVEKLRAEDLIGALAQVCRAVGAQGLAPVVRQDEGDLRVRERVVRDEVRQMKTLGRLGAQELAARWGVEEKIAHRQGRAARARRRLHVAHAPAFDQHARALGFCAQLRDEFDARNRRDGGQGLAAKAERANLCEVFGAADLRGRVPLEREQCIVARHAAAVVCHAQEPAPARLHVHLYAPRARVQSVLHQLLRDRSRPLHHFARGDLIDEMI